MGSRQADWRGSRRVVGESLERGVQPRGSLLLFPLRILGIGSWQGVFFCISLFGPNLFISPIF